MDCLFLSSLSEALHAQVKQTIEDLGVEYLDLYCIHWPVPLKHVAAYVALQELQQEGMYTWC